MLREVPTGAEAVKIITGEANAEARHVVVPMYMPLGEPVTPDQALRCLSPELREYVCKGEVELIAVAEGKLNFPEQDASPEPLFKCRACGCNELQVTRRFTRSTHVEATLSCDCGAEEVATIHRYRIDALFEQIGTLDDGHQYELDAPDEIEVLGTEQEEYEVRCPACADGADETCWEIDPSQVETEDCEDEFYVSCQGCGRQIEFGWSHPERAGRIWPAECADFDPWKCVPEPQYAGSWRTKGWLREHQE